MSSEKWRQSCLGLNMLSVKMWPSIMHVMTVYVYLVGQRSILGSLPSLPPCRVLFTAKQGNTKKYIPPDYGYHIHGLVQGRGYTSVLAMELRFSLSMG